MKSEKLPVIVDIERCKGCELCIYYCPQKCLVKSQEFNRVGNNPVRLIGSEKCNSCGICYIVCPDYALTIY